MFCIFGCKARLQQALAEAEACIAELKAMIPEALLTPPAFSVAPLYGDDGDVSGFWTWGHVDRHEFARSCAHVTRILSETDWRCVLPENVRFLHGKVAPRENGSDAINLIRSTKPFEGSQPITAVSFTRTRERLEEHRQRVLAAQNRR